MEIEYPIEKNERPELFVFDEQDIQFQIIHKMNINSKASKSFTYVHEKLVLLGFHLDITDQKEYDLDSVKMDEGKNYNWVAITSGDYRFIIRQFGTHSTVFWKKIKVKTYPKEDGSTFSFNRVKNGAFLFSVKESKLSDAERDEYYDKPLTELTKMFPRVIEMMDENILHLLWNNLSFQLPKHCKVETCYEGESISSLDKFAFACDELSSKHLALFAENEMLEKLKTLKVGADFGTHDTIESISTEFPKQYSDPYYHGVGLNIISKTRDEKSKWHDVYSLTRYYFDEVFVKEK